MQHYAVTVIASHLPSPCKVGPTRRFVFLFFAGGPIASCFSGFNRVDLTGFGRGFAGFGEMSFPGMGEAGFGRSGDVGFARFGDVGFSAFGDIDFAGFGEIGSAVVRLLFVLLGGLATFESAIPFAVFLPFCFFAFAFLWTESFVSIGFLHSSIYKYTYYTVYIQCIQSTIKTFHKTSPLNRFFSLQ